jgi:hypothetical protein
VDSDNSVLSDSSEDDGEELPEEEEDDELCLGDNVLDFMYELFVCMGEELPEDGELLPEDGELLPEDGELLPEDGELLPEDDDDDDELFKYGSSKNVSLGYDVIQVRNILYRTLKRILPQYAHNCIIYEHIINGVSQMKKMKILFV